MRLGFGVGTIDVGFTGGVSDAADGGLLSSTFLSNYGPYGMVMDFTDASISINDETDVLDYSSQGTVSATTGALLGPGSKLTYTAPSLKFTEQADGFIAGQAHNLYLNSATPANQSITVISGATYAITITGSVSITLSGAATGTVTAGTTTFTAASGTLTCGSTSGSGTVHVRRTPSVSTYVATTSAAVYDLPYVFSGGVKTGIRVESAATNVHVTSNDLSSAAWTKRGITTATKNQTGPDGIANSACRIANLGSVAGVNDIYEAAYSGVRFTASQAITESFYLRKVTASGVLRVTNASSGVLYYSIDFSILGDDWERITPTHPAVTTGTMTATAGGIFGPIFLAQSGTLDFDIYCPQLETGTVATSPIITYGAAVTRALDNIYITTSLFPYSSTTCFLYGEMITPVGGFQNNSTIIALTVDGSAGNGPSAYVQASSTNSVAAWNSGSVTKNYLSSPAAGSTQKMAACFNTSGTLAAATNQGQAVATSAASAWNGTSNRLQIGGLSAFGVQNARAVTSRIMFLPEYDTAKAAAVTA